ncbi:MAG: hypothetical protein GC149_14635 [Gammaproteobacteria bacterium]|nr:hypothetical protein [Gammaproteobacteria bacterium]
MGRLRNALMLLIGLGFTTAVYAIDVVKEFSAMAVQQAPGKPAFQAKMYVSKNAVRTDYKINDTNVIEIVFPQRHLQVLLVPGEKIYLESENKTSVTAAEKNTSDKNPCAGRPDTECKSLGKETINNRETEKWEFLTKRNGRTFRSLHWIDVQRHMPIREFLPDGTVTELKIVGRDKMDGRDTEKWLFQITRADGQSVTSTQWYDPELQMAIREDMPGGYLRELRDIKTGDQKKSLFEIPKDFHKVEQLPAKLRPPVMPEGTPR